MIKKLFIRKLVYYKEFKLLYFKSFFSILQICYEKNKLDRFTLSLYGFSRRVNMMSEK